MNFDQAFERTIGYEGGMSNDPDDRGGLTKYGISQRAYPALDIENLTLWQAKMLYHRDYWGPAGCDTVPDALKADLFDAAVNSGVKAAVRMLQRAVGEVPDGIIGPRTLQALQSMPPARLVARFNGERLAYMADAPTWNKHSRGWARRIAANLRQA